MNLPDINKRKIISMLKEDKRLDNRDYIDYRDIEIEADVSINAEGSSRVKLGKTEVIVGVKIATQEPYPDHDDEGTMSVSMEFSPVSSARYESGPPKIDAIEVARIVDRGIRESGFVDWKKLCIKEKEKVWAISIDIYCINDDGNVLDASAIGAIAALKLAKMPVYDEKEGKVKYGEMTEDPIPLTKNVPFSITFYKIGEKLLLDPTRDEEDASDARFTLAISAPKKEKIINAMQKGGVTSITIEELEKIISDGEKVYESIFPIIDKKIKELGK